MKKRTGQIFICALTIIAVLGAPASPLFGTNESGDGIAYAAEKIAAPEAVKAVRASATSLKVSWSKVDGASGYAVYRCNPKTTKYKLVKSLGKSKLTWTNKKLKSNQIYKYKVRAFTKENGKKKYSADSYIVSATPNTTKAKKVNVKSIKVDYTSRYLGFNRAFKVSDARVSVPKGKKAISKKLTWVSSDPTIVKVTQTGWIQGRGIEGTAKVYIRAHNGVTKTLKITVDDYANPDAFELDQVTSINAGAASLLQLYREPMCRVAAFLAEHKTNVMFYYDDGDVQALGEGFDTTPIDSDLELLTKNADMGIILERGLVGFGFECGGNEYFVCYTDYDGADNPESDMIKIAPCWFFFGQFGG